MLEGKEVTWFPSYGAEMRGGTANCTVIISEELIGSPVVTNPDTLIVMSEASLRKFHPKLKHNGLLLFDTSLMRELHFKTDIGIIGVPATDIASKIGNTKSANMVLLGAYIALTGILNKSSVFEAIESSFPGKKINIIENNKKAVTEGMAFIEDKESQDIGSKADSQAR
jgi:2-oxoglutarate ferredoxin oxidoreductase subunit gamma